MNKFFYVIFSCFFWGIMSGVAGDVHTFVTSEHVEINNHDEKISFFFNDDVCVNGENFSLTSNSLEVFFEKTQDTPNEHKIDKLRAVGDVKFFQHNRSGCANEAILLPKEGIMYLLGDAEIADEDGIVKGDKLYIDRNTRSVKAESCKRSKISIPQSEHLTDSLFATKKKVEDKKIADKSKTMEEEQECF